MAREHGEMQAVLAYLKGIPPLLDAIAEETQQMHRVAIADCRNFQNRVAALQELEPSDLAEHERALLAEMAAAARVLRERVDTLVARNRTRMKLTES
jgi:limonene-1,2-epoxide hydrolase